MEAVETTKGTGYHFCTACREQGRTRRISRDQALLSGLCAECAAEQAGAEVAEVAIEVGVADVADAQAPDLVIVVEAAPKAKAKRVAKPKVGQPCGCGCGGTTKGGRFLPGHDAKLASALKKAAAGAPAPKAKRTPKAA